MKKIILCLILCIFLCGCQNDGINNENKIVNVAEVKKLKEDGAILIDVRTVMEYNEQHIEGALLLPLDDINKESVSKIAPDIDTNMIVYCASGARSSMAVEKLKKLGYENVFDLGSMDNWED